MNIEQLQIGQTVYRDFDWGVYGEELLAAEFPEEAFAWLCKQKECILLSSRCEGLVAMPLFPEGSGGYALGEVVKAETGLARTQKESLERDKTEVERRIHALTKLLEVLYDEIANA